MPEVDYFKGHVCEVVKLAEILFAHKAYEFIRDVNDPSRFISKLDLIKQAGYMHDCIEDGKNPDEIREIIRSKFRPEVFFAVCLLTKIKGIDDNQYLNGIERDEIARCSKICDLLHNLHSSPTAKAKDRYLKSIAILWKAELK